MEFGHDLVRHGLALIPSALSGMSITPGCGPDRGIQHCPAIRVSLPVTHFPEEIST